MKLAAWKSPTLSVRVWPILALLAVFLMETITISLWYQAVFQPFAISWTATFAILLVIFLTSHLLARGMESLHWRMLYRQIFFAVWVLLIMFLSLKVLLYANQQMGLGRLVSIPLRFITRGDGGDASFFHLILIGLLVWRGVALTRSPVTLNSAQASFQFGLAALLLYGMIFAPLYPMQATAGLYEFLFCGLIAMSAARIANLSELRGGRIPRFGLGWFTSIFLAGLVLVGVAILAGSLISGRIIDFIAIVLFIIFSLLTALTLIILSPLLGLLAELMPLLSDFFQNLLDRLKNLGFSDQLQKMVNQLSSGIERVMPVIKAGRGAILLSIIVVLLVVILLALRLRKMQRKMIEEEETSAGSTDTAPGLLQKLLSRLLNDARNFRLRNPAQILAAARIRQIYRQLMVLSSKMGAERPPSITPLEFLPQVEKLFPEEEAGLRAITGAYLKVRYGEYPETREEVSVVEESWERVRRKGRKILSARKRK
jgi:hypothetical protein